MNTKYLILGIIFFLKGTISMSQSSIGLSNLLAFQQQQSPSYIANFLNTSGGWVTDHTNFQDTRGNYKWFKANPGEEFESHTKDEVSYKTPLASYKSAIAYRTVTKSNFDAIKASITSSMTLDATLINDPKVKMYKYSNANNVIEVLEPLQPQKDNLFNYVFVVYNKQDYNNGFRIK